MRCDGEWRYRSSACIPIVTRQQRAPHPLIRARVSGSVRSVDDAGSKAIGEFDLRNLVVHQFGDVGVQVFP